MSGPKRNSFFFLSLLRERVGLAEQAEGSFLRAARISFDVLIKKALAPSIFGVCATLISSVCVCVCVDVSMCTLSYSKL